MPEWIIKYWIEWLFGLVIAGISLILRRLNTRLKHEKEARESLALQAEAENKALKDGMRSILRRQILADCEEALAAGWCDATTKSTIREMYEAYHALGGNDVVTSTYNDLMNLPIIRSVYV